MCFDTGGLSLKTGSYMKDMKFDMSGASISASIFFALAQHGFSKNCEFMVALPIAENLIGPESVKVDSVIESFSGKTVEITNTDAEGEDLWRLPLDDYYLKELKSGIADIKSAAKTGTIYFYIRGLLAEESKTLQGK
ncbi:hypothetical protein PVNG_02396 [Plasmodium vivax North Korean]|uniref:Cytosol aminopeptidase domain-containing protein n=1 Tax=Plasmodium vivax North Korean TaxID=1035514 RepID=A0A0J9W6Q1_PLAVI|nr:hypothetical protein PVNG_02396 [Plasmodium vivax North Korean]